MFGTLSMLTGRQVLVRFVTRSLAALLAVAPSACSSAPR